MSINAVQPVEKTSVSTPTKQKQDIDVLALAYMLLLEAATTNADSATIRSKQLQANALQQQSLNRQEAALKNYSLPQAQIHKHSKTVEVTKQKMTNGHLVHYFVYTRLTWKTVQNQGSIDLAEQKNQEISAERDALSDKLRVLQQLSQVGETGVNTQIQDSLQAMQEGSYLMDILHDLTFNALLRPPVQS